MKFSTGSSSSSLASDSLSRKSTLCIYTDSDFLNGPDKMDANCSGGSSGSASAPQDDIATLRREVATLHGALRLQSGALAREQQRAGGLAARLARRDTAHEARRAHADRQAATLLRALLVLEASLRREQTTIVQKLQTKDRQIVRQREEIQRLKRERRSHCSNCQQLVGFTSEQTNIETDPEFHSLDSVETQKIFERSQSYHESHLQPFQKNSRLSKSFQVKNEVKYGNTSSSEEVFETNEVEEAQGKGTYVKNKQVFVRKDVTRRSRKFSGRRQSSAYLDSVQKRQNRSQASTSSADDGSQSDKNSKLYHLDGDENCDIGEEISKDIERASNRIDELLNNANNSNQYTISLQSPTRRNDSLSAKIDNLHGIRKTCSSDETSYNSIVQRNNVDTDMVKVSNGNPENPWYTNVSDPELELECHYGTNSRLAQSRSMSADDIISASSNAKSSNVANNATFGGNNLLFDSPATSSNNESNSDKESNLRTVIKNKNYQCTNKPGLKNSSANTNIYETCKFDNEHNENWYASASDPDEDPSCEIYKNNPVLECVNQILLQNSLDENSSDSPRQYESPSPKSSTKRVQFSTLNSISFDESVGKNGHDCAKTYPRDLQRAPQERRSANKIVKFSLETSSEHSYEVPIPNEAFNYEVQSIYSNDYEPIITKPNGAGGTDSKITPIPLPRTINHLHKGSNNEKRNTVVKNMAKSLENKINGNHYVDMDPKFVNLPSALNKRKVPRVPPALPPKPKNLVSKFKLTNANPGGLISLPGNGTTATNSDPVASNQRTTDVPSAKGKNIHNTSGSIKSSVSGEPDYCSISEINVPVVSSGKRGLISTEATVEIHTEKFSQNIAEKRSLPKLATISKISPNKICDKDIPKLPQVTEIIIPDDEDSAAPQKATLETYGTKPPHALTTSNKKDHRNSIQMGHSVSTILTDIKNRSVSIEDVNKCIMSTDMNRSFSNVVAPKTNFPVTERSSIRMAEKSRIDLPIFEAVENECEKFDLSQNFEEFKIDDCEFTNIGAEEYRISSSTSDASSTESVTDEASLKETVRLKEALTVRNPADGPYRIEFTAEDDLNAKNLALNAANNDTSKSSLKIYSKMSNKPDLLSNIDAVETDSVRYSDLESSNSSSSNCGSYNTVKCEPSTFNKEIKPTKSESKTSLPFEYFLESSGLSSKSILTPSRPPSSNHKSVQKPKDVKMKSKTTYSLGRVTPLYEKCGPNTAIKYFEPYL